MVLEEEEGMEEDELSNEEEPKSPSRSEVVVVEPKFDRDPYPGSPNWVRSFRSFKTPLSLELYEFDVDSGSELPPLTALTILLKTEDITD